MAQQVIQVLQGIQVDQPDTLVTQVILVTPAILAGLVTPDIPDTQELEILQVTQAIQVIPEQQVTLVIPGVLVTLVIQVLEILPATLVIQEQQVIPVIQD